MGFDYGCSGKGHPFLWLKSSANPSTILQELAELDGMLDELYAQLNTPSSERLRGRELLHIPGERQIEQQLTDAELVEQAKGGAPALVEVEDSSSEEEEEDQLPTRLEACAHADALLAFMSCYPDSFSMEQLAALDAIGRRLDADAFAAMAARQQQSIRRFFSPTA